MQYWLFDLHFLARHLLDSGYDTVGVNAVEGFLDSSASVNHNARHYSGNFWWANSNYLSGLQDLSRYTSTVDFNSRCKAENWVLSGYPKLCAGVMYSWGTHHMYQFEEIPHLHDMRQTKPDCAVLTQHHNPVFSLK